MSRNQDRDRTRGGINKAVRQPFKQSPAKRIHTPFVFFPTVAGVIYYANTTQDAMAVGKGRFHVNNSNMQGLDTGCLVGV